MFFFLICNLILLFCSGEWFSENHSILYKNQIYNIRGVNWFGTETKCNIVHGLWMHPLSYYLDFLETNGINSIRIPFSFEVANNLDQLAEPSCITAEPLFKDKTVREMINILFQETKKRSISILLDFHTINYEITPFPWTNEINKEKVINILINMIAEFKENKNLLGIDIKNEPHGSINWYTWSSYIRDFKQRIELYHNDFEGLIFICGIEDPIDNSAWGGSFYTMGETLDDILDEKIVFAPHVYGPSVRGWRGEDNSPDDWEKWFGFLHHTFENAIVLGELGGTMIDSDELWHWTLKDYLVQNNIQNFYYWCLNSNSIDTNGIFDFDWTTVDEKKLDFIKYLQPNPTFLNF